MINALLFNLFLDLSLIALPVSIFLSSERNFGKAVMETGFRKIPLGKLLKQAAKIFLVLIAVSIWLSLILSFAGINDLGLVSEAVKESRSKVPLFILFVALRAVSEETFFRGLLVKKTGVLGSSAIFAMFHFGYGSMAEILGAFALGLILGKAFELNKNLYPNIVAHLAYNLIAISAI